MEYVREIYTNHTGIAGRNFNELRETSLEWTGEI